jgi:hypothetical protein
MLSAMRVLASRFLGLFRRNHFDHAMDEEFQSHLEMLADRFVSQGMTKSEALVAAKRQFGGVTQIQEQLRDRSSLPFLESFWGNQERASSVEVIKKQVQPVSLHTRWSIVPASLWMKSPGYSVLSSTFSTP